MTTASTLDTRNKASRLPNILNIYLFFFYFSGVTHLLLQLNNATIFVGLRQAIYMTLLWLIPIMLFPQRTKAIAGLIGLVLLATSLISLGYFCIYGQEFSQSVLFVIFESNVAESSEYIAQYFKWWMLPLFGGHTLIAFLLWRRIRPLHLSTTWALTFSTLILIFLFIYPMGKELLVKHSSWDGAIDKLQRRMEPAEPWQLAIGYLQYQKQLANMEALLAQNNSLQPLKNLQDQFKNLPATMVLVIGESTNRQHMSLYGYPRKTTPKLDRMNGELAVFKHVVSSRPMTIEALNQVLTFADQENPDLYLTKPTLMNMMKDAGYKTYWITNQQTISKRNTMLTNFSKQMDEQYYMNHSRAQNSREYDGNVFAPFEKVLNDDAPRKFIVIHLLGTHMKYDYRYPPEFAQFSDGSDLSAELSEDEKTVVNSYDNAVLYNDHVISTLIHTLDDTDHRAALVYLSDHGEDVFDTPPHDMLGRNEGKPSLAMYAVPFILWTSPEWQSATPRQFNDQLERPYSTAHFIHTWSDLAGLTYDGYDASKSLINPEFVRHPLWIGDPENRDGLRELLLE